MKQRMAWVASAAFFVAWLTAGAGPASASATMSVCLPHEEAVDKLEKSHGEQKIGTGLGPRGASVVELFVSESGTWTVLVTRTNGMSCVAASGDNWTSESLLVGDAV